MGRQISIYAGCDTRRLGHIRDSMPCGGGLNIRGPGAKPFPWWVASIVCAKGIFDIPVDAIHVRFQNQAALERRSICTCILHEPQVSQQLKDHVSERRSALLSNSTIYVTAGRWCLRMKLGLSLSHNTTYVRNEQGPASRKYHKIHTTQ